MMSRETFRVQGADVYALRRIDGVEVVQATAARCDTPARAHRLAHEHNTRPALIRACQRLVSMWSAYMADETLMNPHDAGIAERIADIDAALEATKEPPR
jgi:hypothetical protein